jgi:uncharacterized protein YdcH (DUF465 family)
MSNYENETDKLKTHLDELKRKHRSLDEHIAEVYQNKNLSPEVYKLKTHKLWLKDEIHRVENKLSTLGNNNGLV